MPKKKRLSAGFQRGSSRGCSPAPLCPTRDSGSTFAFTLLGTRLGTPEKAAPSLCTLPIFSEFTKLSKHTNTPIPWNGKKPCLLKETPSPYHVLLLPARPVSPPLGWQSIQVRCEFAHFFSACMLVSWHLILSFTSNIRLNIIIISPVKYLCIWICIFQARYLSQISEFNSYCLIYQNV